MSIWKPVDTVTWSTLAGWQRSFGSKAAIALPLIGFVVASIPSDTLRNYLADNWRIHTVFWGAVVFLLGQLVLWLRRPIEFARDTDVHQDIAEARRIGSFDIFRNRRALLAQTVERIKKAKVADAGTLALAEDRLAEANDAEHESDNWKPCLVQVVLAQRALREVDNRTGRRITVMLLGLGTLMMALPTTFNILKTAGLLLAAYYKHLTA